MRLDGSKRGAGMAKERRERRERRVADGGKSNLQHLRSSAISWLWISVRFTCVHPVPLLHLHLQDFPVSL